MENACATSLTGAVRLVQLLKIDGYCATNGMNDEIISRWSVDGHEWEIYIYPNCQSSVALELVYRSPGGMEVRANLGCRLVDPRGILKPSQEKSVSGSFRYTYDLSPKLWLVKRQDLESSGYLTDDALTLQCTITVFKKLPVQEFPVKAIPQPPSNLHQHLGELLQNGTGVDVTILVSGELFSAHKLVLAARSPVFMAEFFGHMMEKSSQIVEVKDMEAAVFKALLSFIYTDTLPDFDQEQETAMSQHLLAAADRYGLDRLKLICAGKLSASIDVETAAATLALAEQHNCSQLKARCIEFIFRTPAVRDAVLATQGYKHLESSCPSVLTDLLRGGGRN